jgi:hypothetical protein
MHENEFITNISIIHTALRNKNQCGELNAYAFWSNLGSVTFATHKITRHDLL